MATASKTGKAGSLTIDSTNIPITKAAPRFTIDFADSTDSSNFISATSTLPKSQLGGASQIELSIEGYWDANTTTSDVIAKMLSPDSGPWPIVVKLDGSTTIVSGNFDLVDFSSDLTIPGASMYSFTCTARSNGAYVIN